MSGGDRQRIDKWLWFARVVKTRSLAQDLAESGHVRLNGRKVDAAAQAVKVGDVLTIGLHGRVRILKVITFAERRGGFPEAQRLYEDLSPPTAGGQADEAADGSDEDGGAEGASSAPVLPDAPVPVRGAGRPTKRDRRRMPGEG